MRKGWGIILDWPDVIFICIIKQHESNSSFLPRLQHLMETLRCIWRLVDVTLIWFEYWWIMEQMWIRQMEKAKLRCTLRQLKEMKRW